MLKIVIFCYSVKIFTELHYHSRFVQWMWKDLVAKVAKDFQVLQIHHMEISESHSGQM